jgi:hypothetical protein
MDMEDNLEDVVGKEVKLSVSIPPVACRACTNASNPCNSVITNPCACRNDATGTRCARQAAQHLLHALQKPPEHHLLHIL